MKETNISQNFSDGCFSFRAAALIIQNNQILVAKNQNYNCFYIIGGCVHAYEDSETAAIREVFEETGFNMEIDRLIFINERFFQHDNQKHHEIAFYYLMKFDECPIIEGTETDYSGETFHWLPIKQLHKYNLVPAFLKKRLQELPGKVVHIVTQE